MSTYTFKSQYGDYSFSDTQIEANKYLTREQKDILRSLAEGQSTAIRPRSSGTIEYFKPNVSKYYYDVYETTPSKARELVKTPAEYEFEADIAEKRWYESWSQFTSRKTREFEKRNTKRTKEVRRDKVVIDKSTFADGTEITKIDRDIKFF